MAIEIYGVFDNKEDVIKEVELLSLKGIPSRKITIFALQPHTEELDEHTDVNVRNPQIDEEQFIHKIMKVFMPDTGNERTVRETLAIYGLQGEQVEQYTNAIESGKILIIVSTDVKMGHDSTHVHASAHASLRLHQEP